MVQKETSRKSWRYILVAMLAVMLGVALSASAAFAGLPANSSAGPPVQGKGSDALTAREAAPGKNLGSAIPAPANPAVVLYDQYNNDLNNGIVSANRTDNPSLSAQAADDFVIPSGQTWTINQVDIRSPVGFSAPTSFNVYFYTDAATLPGTQVYSAVGLPVGGTNPDYQITLTTPAILTAGTYWVSAQGTISGSNWYWEGRSVTSNSATAWREGGGYGTPCTNWGRLSTCIGQAWPDQMFRINGTLGGATATPGSPTATVPATSTPCPIGGYTTAVSTGATIVPGTVNLGIQCDDCYAPVALPFAYTLYDQSFTSVQVGSNGNVIFGTGSLGFSNSCLPAGGVTYLILPHWDDLYTVDAASGQGIFSSVSGSAPNRIFNIEWRTEFCCNSGPPVVNFELRLYEGQTRFDVIYGTPMSGNGGSATSGVQKDGTTYTQYSCNTATLTPGTMVTYTLGAGGCPSPVTATTTRTVTTVPPTVTTTRTATVPAATSTPGCSPFLIEVEPNDTFANPQVLPTSNQVELRGAINPVGDVDRYQFAATAGDRVWAYLYTLGAVNSTDSQISLVNPVSQTIQFDDDNGSQAALASGIAGAPVTTTGNLQLEVNQFGNSSTINPYTLFLDRTSGALIPEVEPNDTITTANAYAIGSVVTATIPISTDLDTFSFTATAGDRLVIQADGDPERDGVQFNPNLRILDSAGTQLVLVNDESTFCGTGCPPGAVIRLSENHLFTFPNAGTYYVQVVSESGTTGSYNLHIWRPIAPPCGSVTPTATCVPQGGSYRVLVARGDTSQPTALISQIQAEPGVVSVTEFDTAAGTPTLAQLQQYEIVVTFSNFQYADPTAMGNVLADYIDSGGVVVVMTFANYSGWELQGRYMSGGYNSYPVGNSLHTATGTLGTYNNAHPLMQGITALSTNYHVAAATPVAGATQVAAWNDGDGMVAYKTVGSRTSVQINGYVGAASNMTGQWGKLIVNAGRWLRPSVPCGSVTATSTVQLTATRTATTGATATCIPSGGGTPGPWITSSPIPTAHYGSSMDSDGTYAYDAGGYSFQASGMINQFARYNPTTDLWTTLTPVPDLNNGMASMVYAPNTNKLYVFGGSNFSTQTVTNVSRIYDIATGVWTAGPVMPDVRAFMASGYYNGKIYLVGGYSTGNVDPAFAQVWEFDPITNTYNTTRAPMPATLGGAGFGVIGDKLYVAGGRNLANTNLNTLYEYNITTNTWTTKANLPTGVNVPGSAVIGGKLWVYGGGNPFSGDDSRGSGSKPQSSSAIDVPDTTNITQIYDPVTNTWTAGPNLTQGRSFIAGTDVGSVAIAVGGYNGSTTVALTEENNTTGGGGCPTPGTATVTRTVTAGATATCAPGGGPIIVNGAITTSDPTQVNRLFRDGIPDTCAAPGTCGTPISGTYHYDAYTYTNTSGAQVCINVNANTACTGTNFIYVGAYLGTFDPNNICTNFAASMGSSPNPTGDFSFNVPAGASYTIVVAEVTANAGCPAYTLTITGGSGGGCVTPGTATTTAVTTATRTATSGATATCVPGGTPGPWTAAAPYPRNNVRYGFAQVGNSFYVIGGVSDGSRIADVNRYDVATNTWTARAPIPVASEGPTCAYHAANNSIYCAEGDTGTGFFRYDIAANTWTTLANVPGASSRYGAASGAFNGKVFVTGGSSSFSNNTQVYDIATNTWTAGPVAPSAFLLAGYQQVGQYLYVIGGFSGTPADRVESSAGSVLNAQQKATAPDANNATSYRLDMTTAPGVWSTGPAFTQARADFGLAYDGGTGKLYAMGGDASGGGFFDSTTLVDELSVSTWPAGAWVASPPNLPTPARQANQAGFYSGGQIYSVGGINGSTFQFLPDNLRRSNGGGGCPVSPTVTPQVTSTTTRTVTRTPSVGPTSSPTCAPGGPLVITGSIDGTEPSHNSVNGATSACGTTTACPGELAGAFNYDTYPLANTSGSPVCVTVTLSDATCIYSEVYSGPVDPNNSCTNYVADSNLGASYSFTIPANTTYNLVIEEFNKAAGCPNYTVTVIGLPGGNCGSPTPATATATRTVTVQPTATRTVTLVPATSTSTIVPATGTPTRTSTRTPSPSPTSPLTGCVMPFTDVNEFNPFYIYIKCLYCRGIISGYNTGCPTGNPCFKPNNDITRGQIAKIVSNAAGFSEPVSGQRYTDVPPTHTFYVWIMRLTYRGHMGGYSDPVNCAGVGTPCFRPERSATRGQLAKIVSNAAGFAEPPVGQAFTDVPPSHTFYAYIQRLSRRGVISGYDCGEIPSEPCDPQNRPYFRPQNNVTRGQASKIVSNTFFPLNCQPGEPELRD